MVNFGKSFCEKYSVEINPRENFAIPWKNNPKGSNGSESYNIKEQIGKSTIFQINPKKSQGYSKKNT